ncbi:MAG: alcohol dehydrogenase catalytic domain-containing protein [Candidatus Eremiobacteraeota bacterium]|nr:alcohol dehydrogenase catalytic domain-containing protein [Candidatus Eremiobacteraeota bacterium]MBC5828467.1 alcohol dehydrogenase catalytic domain-containing protein [Candidatus Eremiobacteraeota bacterium]
MRQAVLTAPKTLEWRELADVPPGRGEVTVRIRAALTCGTDLKTFRRGHQKLEFGPFGHEAAGDIAAVGAGVEGFAVGDAVMWVPTAPCGRCAQCAAARPNLCQKLFDEIAQGAYGDCLTLAPKIVQTNLYAKPDDLTYVEAAFLEPLACVVHGWNVVRRARAGAAPPARVAIIGAGSIGLLQLLYARHHGIQATVIARNAERSALASRLGADETLTIETAADRRFDIVIECAGTEEAWRQAVALAAPGGSAVFFGGLAAGTQVSLDASRIHYGELACLGSFHFTPADVREARDLLATAKLDVRPLISGVAPLSQLAEVFARLDQRDGYKYALIPQPPVQWV